jgi:phage-related protein
MVRDYEYIIYKGEYFSVEWYYSEKGECQAKDYYDNMNVSSQAKFLYLVERMSDHGKISNKKLFNNEGDGLFAFKPQPDRFLTFFTKGKKMIITSAFRKKTKKLPNKEKKKALKVKINYQNRTANGVYYGKK